MVRDYPQIATTTVDRADYLSREREGYQEHVSCDQYRHRRSLSLTSRWLNVNLARVSAWRPASRVPR